MDVIQGLYYAVFTDGSVLVGSSELTGRYWDGGASIFKDIVKAKSYQTQDKRCITLESGTADGCFVESYQKVNFFLLNIFLLNIFFTKILSQNSPSNPYISTSPWSTYTY